MQAGLQEGVEELSTGQKDDEPQIYGNETSVIQTLPRLPRFLSIWLLICILSETLDGRQGKYGPQFL